MYSPQGEVDETSLEGIIKYTSCSWIDLDENVQFSYDPITRSIEERTDDEHTIRKSKAASKEGTLFEST